MAAVKLSELMKQKMLLSFELFPPKTDKGMANLPGTIEHLCKYRPEYIPVHTVPVERMLAKIWKCVS